MATPKIRWQDPPTTKNGQLTRGRWELILEPLMSHPGRWAIIATKTTPRTTSSTANNLRHRIVRIPTGQWEFRAAGCDVYARYVGPE